MPNNNFIKDTEKLERDIAKIWVPTPLPSIFLEGKELPLLGARGIRADLNNNVDTNFENNINWQNSNDADHDYNATSLLGTPIYDSIVLSYEADNYSGSNSSFLGGPKVSFGAVFEVVKFTVTQSRNIVTTPVNGLDGTVKEFISDSDFIINCDAQIVFNGINYIDYDYLQGIQNLFLIQNTIKIESTIINNVFNIYNVVIKDYNFGQPEVGMRNVQNISFSLLSDNPDNYNFIF